MRISRNPSWERSTKGERLMRIAVGSDERSELTDALIAELEERGHKIVAFGPVAEQEESDWPLVCGRVAEAVASGEADEGIVCCWTGTGASIAANKVPGIRAALIHDAETARGARIWNHANVLALSLRATPIPVMREILDAWYGTSSSEGEAQSDWNKQQIDRIRQLEEKYRRADVEQS
jgi:ribose 5-phosphate isomerase B